MFADAAATNTNWIVDLEVFAAANPALRLDAFAGATLVEGTDLELARESIATVVDDFPQVELLDQAEFRRTQEDQLDQLLRLVYGLLAFAVLIAVLGITLFDEVLHLNVIFGAALVVAAALFTLWRARVVAKRSAA